MDISPYEAIVVGSGATGGIAALTLAEQGIKVLVIEAGPQVKKNMPINANILVIGKIILTYIQMN